MIVLQSCAPTRPEGMLPTQTGIEGYPAVIEGTLIRRQSSMIQWRLFLAEHGMRQIEPDLHPILMTPQSLPASLAGKVRVPVGSGDMTEEAAREALRSFVKAEMPLLAGGERLLVPALKDLSLIKFETTTDGYAATYHQMSFGYSITGGLGTLDISIKKNGDVTRLRSTLLPRVQLPGRPQADVARFSEALKDREFTYSAIDGRPLKYKVSPSDPISVKEIVVHPRQDKERVLLYLAYPVEVGQGTTWTVYFDAITGDELDVRPNFVS